jgi:hypothetical protein
MTITYVSGQYHKPLFSFCSGHNYKLMIIFYFPSSTIMLIKVDASPDSSLMHGIPDEDDNGLEACARVFSNVVMAQLSSSYIGLFHSPPQIKYQVKVQKSFLLEK